MKNKISFVLTFHQWRRAKSFLIPKQPHTMADSSTIYGLEFQSRALAPQQAENNEIRFFIATQSLKPNNQVHLVEFNEETSSLTAKIFSHPLGEVWKLNSSPHDSRILLSCFSCQKGAQVVTQSAILKLPESLDCDENQEFLTFENADVMSTEEYGTEVRTTEFHPTDSKILSSIIDGKIVLWDQGEAKPRVFAEINAKTSPKFTMGKWSQHHQGNQFVALHDCSIRSYDIRDMNHCAWSIEDAHGQFVRDLDCNPNKQCHIVTGGDDGCLKIWDSRMPKEPIFARNDHSHWVWSVRFNTFHDQLILSGSSDCKVLLTCAGSVSSENEEDLENKKRLSDGLLQTFDQHEDSVYCVEWSSVDPWIFASLSYDGRVIISKVPKQYKYQILF